MFRHQFHAEVKLGRFRDFYTTFEAFDTAVRAKNLISAAAVGPIVRQYQQHRDRARARHDGGLRHRQSSLPRRCGLHEPMRELSQLVEGTPWDELWETAPQIA